MHWVTVYGRKSLHFLEGEFSFIFTGLAITLAGYAALYLFSSSNSGPRSLRGFARHLFPFEIFRHSRIDFFVYVIAKLVWAPVIAKLLAFLAFEATALRLLNALFGNRVLTAANSWAMLLVQFLAFYLVSTFAYYWAHRAMHQNRFLWSVHRAHHSAETLTFLTGSRAHPLDPILVGIWGTLLLGIAAATLSYCTGVVMHPLFLTVAYFWLIIVEVVDKFQHSHVRTSLGPLNYFVPLGDMHQIHHSAELKHRDKNFGNVSLLFDWMFGTIYIPEPTETVRLGLNEQELGAQNPHNRLIDIYTEPFEYAWRALKRKNSAERPATITAGPLKG
jgi:sterol desaturase/sphingolipid hydroxylase (fatty acid hydroxylase superfamily)